MLLETSDAVISHSAKDTPFTKKDLPRKRSKVSRACDACRRKKIRCNAEYSSALSRVTKVCTNCTKAGDDCLFSRVPMKRGPSKGYIRDLVNQIDDSERRDELESVSSSDYRPRSRSVDAANLKVYSQSGMTFNPTQPYPPPIMSQPFGTSHVTHFANLTPTPQMAQPIVLPPLVGAKPSTQPVKMTLPIPKYSVSLSPRTSGAPLPNMPNVVNNVAPEEQAGHVIQGPLWSVPYEMPASSTPRSFCSESRGPNSESRRSSVDSLSSISTSGSVSRHTSMHPPSLYSEAEDTDSGYSEINSPRNSVSSMSSLNGRVANNLSIGGAVANSSHYQPVAPALYEQNRQTHSASHVQTSATPLPSHQMQPDISKHSSPFSSTKAPPTADTSFQSSTTHVYGIQAAQVLDYNLGVYYHNFHSAFPILLHDKSVYKRLISELKSSPVDGSCVVRFFLSSLENLINYQSINFENVKDSILQFTTFYPFNTTELPCTNEVLYLMFGGLILVNYTISLRGDSCSTGIALAQGAFQDYKIPQAFKKLSSLAEKQDIDCDSIASYLPRLFSCLCMLDVNHALCWGTQAQLSQCSSLLTSALAFQFSSCPEFLENVELGKFFTIIEDVRNKDIFAEKSPSKRSPEVSRFGKYISAPKSASIFFNLQKDKYELYDFATEVHEFLKSNSWMDFKDEYTRDHIHDYQLKISRLVKRLSSSILNFADYTSKNDSQPLSPKGQEQISPFFNITYAQSFRLIKVCKDLLESLIANAGDNEIMSRSVKIIRDLAQATTSLKSTFGHVSANFESSKGESSNYSGNQSSLYGPGVAMIQAVIRKVEIYDLNFQDTISIQLNEASERSYESWKNEFLKTASQLIFSENTNGWL